MKSNNLNKFLNKKSNTKKKLSNSTINYLPLKKIYNFQRKTDKK